MAIKDKFCGITEAAELAGCTTGRMRQLLIAGEIKGEKLSDQDNAPWMVDRRSLERYIENRPDGPSRGRPRNGGPQAD